MPGRVYFMPKGSEFLGMDGRQIWYASEDGAGTCIDVGAVEVEWTTDPCPDRELP